MLRHKKCDLIHNLVNSNNTDSKKSIQNHRNNWPKQTEPTTTINIRPTTSQRLFGILPQ